MSEPTAAGTPAGGLVTFTTDFGDASPYVAAMKGALLSVNPSARPIDLSHRIPPQNVRHAAYFLAAAVPYFPPNTIHVVVVDPGVGSARALLYAEAAGQRLLAPDNGCLSDLFDSVDGPAVVRQLREPKFWRPTVSATFHGRDILAPTAGHLSLGVDPAELGPIVTTWQRLDRPRPVVGAERIEGVVEFVDEYGNLLTNIPASMLGAIAGGPVRVAGRDAGRWVRTYADAAPGECVALVSSNGVVEVAVAQGSAAARLGVGVGAAVVVE
jgi:S-adenosylmethionine hydrolase